MQAYRFVPEIIDIIVAVIIYFSAFSLLIMQNFEKIQIWARNKRKEGDEG